MVRKILFSLVWWIPAFLIVLVIATIMLGPHTVDLIRGYLFLGALLLAIAGAWSGQLPGTRIKGGPVRRRPIRKILFTFLWWFPAYFVVQFVAMLIAGPHMSHTFERYLFFLGALPLAIAGVWSGLLPGTWSDGGWAKHPPKKLIGRNYKEKSDRCAACFVGIGITAYSILLSHEHVHYPIRFDFHTLTLTLSSLGVYCLSVWLGKLVWRIFGEKEPLTEPGLPPSLTAK